LHGRWRQADPIILHGQRDQLGGGMSHDEPEARGDSRRLTGITGVIEQLFEHHGDEPLPWLPGLLLQLTGIEELRVPGALEHLPRLQQRRRHASTSSTSRYDPSAWASAPAL
jgi:hypothetical protein